MKILKEVEEILVNKEDSSILRYVSKNKRKLINFGSILASGLSNEKDAMARSMITRSSYLRMKRVYEKANEYCDENDIDIFETEFEELATAMQDIEISKAIAKDKILTGCWEILNDKITVDDKGNTRMLRQGANMKDRLALLAFIDPTTVIDNGRTNININNENNNENTFAKLKFEIISSDIGFKKSIESQEEIYNETKNICEDIERQIANGVLK